MTHPPLLQSQSCQTLADWLCYIEQSHPVEKIELGLERVLRVASRGDLQHLPGRSLLIAGTNGKGTTARTLEQLLLAQGYTVGVYSSPHLLAFNERLRINGVDVDDALWVQGLSQVETLRADTALTYFEFTTLAAFAVLRASKPDFCLIEVGLGGRLDATNIIDPCLSIITTIDLDHQDWLGDNREAIGREKAGVCRAGKPLVVGDLAPPASIAEVAKAQGALLCQAGVDYQFSVQSKGLIWQFGQDNQLELPLPAVPAQNVATALSALRLLQLLPPPALIVKVLHELQLSGRMQWLAPNVLLDVAHNPQSAAYLAEQLRQLAERFSAIRLLVGMLKDKDIASALAPFVGKGYQWHLVSLPGARGADAAMLELALPDNEPRQCHDTLAASWSMVRQARPDELYVVFGSFVTVSSALALWQQESL